MPDKVASVSGGASTNRGSRSFRRSGPARSVRPRLRLLTVHMINPGIDEGAQLRIGVELPRTAGAMLAAVIAAVYTRLERDVLRDVQV